MCACVCVREKPSFTAARECCEETLGVLGSKEELKAALKSYEANNAFKVRDLYVCTVYVIFPNCLKLKCNHLHIRPHFF